MLKQSRISYTVYNSRTAGLISMIFVFLDLSARENDLTQNVYGFHICQNFMNILGHKTLMRDATSSP